MADPESVLGVGLAILGIGGPATVALLRLWHNKNSGSCVTPGQCDTRHEAQDKLFESRLETLDQKIVTVDTKVTTILAIVEARWRPK